jgi:hypothetical protein
MGPLNERRDNMKQYRVTAHITICYEMDVMADNEEDAIEEYEKSMADEFGWIDIDEVKVRQIGGEVI